MPAEDVFDLINPSLLNKELTAMMPGLSAKVFRTYNASIVLEKELANLDIATPVQEKVCWHAVLSRSCANVEVRLRGIC